MNIDRVGYNIDKSFVRENLFTVYTFGFPPGKQLGFNAEVNPKTHNRKKPPNIPINIHTTFFLKYNYTWI